MTYKRDMILHIPVISSNFELIYLSHGEWQPLKSSHDSNNYFVLEFAPVKILCGHQAPVIESPSKSFSISMMDEHSVPEKRP